MVIVNKIEGKDRYVVFVLNPTEADVTIHYKLERITGHDNFYLRDWKTGEFLKNL